MIFDTLHETADFFSRLTNVYMLQLLVVGGALCRVCMACFRLTCLWPLGLVLLTPVFGGGGGGSMLGECEKVTSDSGFGGGFLRVLFHFVNLACHRLGLVLPEKKDDRQNSQNRSPLIWQYSYEKHLALHPEVHTASQM